MAQGISERLRGWFRRDKTVYDERDLSRLMHEAADHIDWLWEESGVDADEIARLKAENVQLRQERKELRRELGKDPVRFPT